MHLSSFFIYSFCLLAFASCANAGSKQQTKEADSDSAFLKLKEDSRNFSAGTIRTSGTENSAAPGALTLYPASTTEAQNAQASAKLANLPSIMVLPANAGSIAECAGIIKNNSFAKASMDAINGYLTKQRYNVKALEGENQIDEIAAIQGQIAGQEEDLSYIASLSLGADIYIKFTSKIANSQIIADLSAYESTTGQLLGSQSAAVNDNGTSKEELVKSAMHKAMPGLENKIKAYWAEEAKQGVQYKVIIRLEGEFSAGKIDDVHSKISRVLKQSFNKAKINVMTDKTVDANIYANPAQVSDAYEVYEVIRQGLQGSFEVRKNSITQKFILMELR
ncbi:MAG: DUF6175 family protein [Fibrobacteraceae bacterium]|nr:DUF6175 family protein [Fibrobacteraceae bacterium]